MLACIRYKGNVGLTGAQSGELQKWSGASFMGVASKNHSGLIHAIKVTDSAIFTGGNDMKVCVLDPASFQLKSQFDCS